MIVDLIPTDAALILRVSDRQAANIAAANARAATMRSDADKMREIANDMRKVLNAQCESYKKLVIDTYLDCDYNKVKISKRVAKVPKYARSVTKGRAMSTVGDSYMKGGVKSRGQDFADKAAV